MSQPLGNTEPTRVRLNIEYKDIIKQVSLRRGDFTPTKDGGMQLARANLMDICTREFELGSREPVALTYENNDTKKLNAYP